ncbi:MAG: hypothetical protein CBC48_16815 [bacterium TMED88]|nr:MAG: hypothetical protein CBC48_16815 [bacterium TMED88]
MINLQKSYKRLKTTLGPKKGLLIFQLKLAVRELGWKLHIQSFRRYVKYRKKLLRNGRPHEIVFGSPTSLKERILLMAVQLTKKVSLLADKISEAL